MKKSDEYDVRGLKWLTTHERELDKFAGRWIAFLEKKGVISSGSTLEEALRKAKSTSTQSPYVFRVPSRKELHERDLTVYLERRESLASRR